jgi:hypothetical protein
MNCTHCTHMCICLYSQGSDEERCDILKAYTASKGNMADVINRVMLATDGMHHLYCYYRMLHAVVNYVTYAFSGSVSQCTVG